LQCAEYLVAIEPAASQNGATATKNDNYNDGNNEGIVLLGFFGDGGHLVVHNFYSCLK
jgi:hypothetical protein